MTDSNLLIWIIAAPLIGSAFLGLFGRKMGERAIGAVACLSTGASAVLAFYAFFAQLVPLGEHERQIHQYLFTWIKVGSFRADFGLLLDPLSGFYILFITFVGFLIHVFATGYMRGEEGYGRFFAYLNLFMFSMLTLILADNFLLMFVGWEGVGLCSYLLIGFYFTKGFAGDAAKKAFIVNRVGDFGFSLGVMLLFWKAGTIFFFDNPAMGVRGAMDWAKTLAVDPLTAGALVAGGITTIAILLFVGAIGKSAQIPLFVWLPDAMAGPTPVSALIHAATMVTAGVYLVSRASFIFVHAPSAMLVVAIIGAATALFAATIGLGQWDIKKVLAYSTISQLGYMFLACGTGAFIGGIFHVFTHAFFKALLFLGSGSVIIALHHEQDMRKMGGLKKYLPVTCWTMVAGWLAISGVPLLSGFFSKDEILYRAFTSDGLFPQPWPTLLWAAGALAALLTAIYMTRLMVLTFWGAYRGGGSDAGNDGHAGGHSDEHHSGPPRESPRAMTIPLIVLALGALFAGYLNVPKGFLGLPSVVDKLLEPVIATPNLSSSPEGQAVPSHEGPTAATPTGSRTPVEESGSTELILAIVSSVIAIAGIAIAWVWFGRDPLWQPPKILEEKYKVDEAYDAIIVNPIKSGSTRVLWKFIDVRIVDGAVNGLAKLAALVGSGLRFLQAGFARVYAAIIVVGAVLIIGYFVMR